MIGSLSAFLLRLTWFIIGNDGILKPRVFNLAPARGVGKMVLID